MTPVAANVQSMKPGISPEEWKTEFISLLRFGWPRCKNGTNCARWN